MQASGSSNDLIDQVHAKASEFRRVIVGALPLGDVVLDSFPCGACGDTAILIGEFLFRADLGVWLYRSGMRDGYTHAWIDKDGLIVDVTADQFDDIDEPVIVTRDATWHETFTPMGGHRPARIEAYEYDARLTTRLSGIYATLFP